ncbi:hypothetical protein V9L13_11195 [Pseudomonas sp. RSB 5.4]|uniref:hypothetical protein n=1 Tax=Pseudomonas sp. RSB 5.4 TaxID=3127459 RepID=UPI0030D4D071
MANEIALPFYTDWKFWSLVVSVLAVILSQLPPIHLLLRPRRLEVEVHSRVQLTHRVGNPNLGLVVGITNSGGRSLRIRSMHLDLVRDGQPLVTLHAQAYFETPSSTSTVLLVPFFLKPGDSWAHAVTFFNNFERQVDKAYRADLARLRTDIRKKIDAQPPDKRELVEAEPQMIAPFSELFRKLFIWETGEYMFTLSVIAAPGSASYTKKYRFTLYESDTEELRQQAERYKYGAGIAYDEQDGAVMVPITEHVG